MPRWARVALVRNRVSQSEWRIDPVASTNAASNLWVAAAPASVSVVRHRLDALLGSHELATHRASDIRLAVTEACTNAIVHAYPDANHGDVLITAETTTHELAVTVRDYGAGIPSDTPSNGLGIGVQLIHSLADTVTITNSNPGLAVRMTFQLEATTSASRGFADPRRSSTAGNAPLTASVWASTDSGDVHRVLEPFRGFGHQATYKKGLAAFAFSNPKPCDEGKNHRPEKTDGDIHLITTLPAAGYSGCARTSLSPRSPDTFRGHRRGLRHRKATSFGPASTNSSPPSHPRQTAHPHQRL